MKTPVCIVSFNRSLYLNALLRSLEGELDHFDVWVCDNGSTETHMLSVRHEWEPRIGFIDLPGGDWINDEYRAKNAFIEMALARYSSEGMLFLQDDMQYVGPVGQLHNVIRDVTSTRHLSVTVTAVRRSTIKSTYSGERVDNVWPIVDNHFGTTGYHRREVFEKVGRYVQNLPMTAENWGHGEDDFHSRVISAYGRNRSIAAASHVPVFAGVWNDPRGHYSFLRGGKRYGHYLPPVAPHKKYYDNMSLEAYQRMLSSSGPAHAFADVAVPLGWSYAKDSSGDQLKYHQKSIILEGPVSEVT